MARSEALQMNLAPKDEQNYHYHSFCKFTSTYSMFIRRRQSSGFNGSLSITLLAEVHVFSG